MHELLGFERDIGASLNLAFLSCWEPSLLREPATGTGATLKNARPKGMSLTNYWPPEATRRFFRWGCQPDDPVVRDHEGILPGSAALGRHGMTPRRPRLPPPFPPWNGRRCCAVPAVLRKTHRWAADDLHLLPKILRHHAAHRRVGFLDKAVACLAETAQGPSLFGGSGLSSTGWRGGTSRGEGGILDRGCWGSRLMAGPRGVHRCVRKPRPAARR